MSNLRTFTISQCDDQVYTRLNKGTSSFNSKFVSSHAKAYTIVEDRFYEKKGNSFKRKLKWFDERCIQNGMRETEKI